MLCYDTLTRVVNAPSERFAHPAVVTGSDMVRACGNEDCFLNDFWGIVGMGWDGTLATEKLFNVYVKYTQQIKRNK